MNFLNFLSLSALLVFLFLVNHLFLPLGWLIDLPVVAVIFFNLNNSRGRLSSAVILGLLNDAVFGTPGVFLLSWLVLAVAMHGLTSVISLSHQLARLFLTVGSLFGYWLLVLGFGQLLGWIFQQPVSGLIFHSPVWQIIIYLLLNSLLVFLAGQLANHFKKSRYVEIV